MWLVRETHPGSPDAACMREAGVGGFGRCWCLSCSIFSVEEQRLSCWEVILTPRNRGLTTDIPPDIPRGHEGAGKTTAFTPCPANPEQALPSQSPPPGTEEGSCGHPRDATALPPASSAASPDGCCWPQVFFPAQRQPSCTTGKPTRLPRLKPMMRQGLHTCM